MQPTNEFSPLSPNRKQ